MISTLTISTTAIKADQKTSHKNKIFSENKVDTENRPPHRKHPYGGSLVWGTYTEPAVINPILTQHTISASLMALIFDSLVRVNSNGEIIPGLAKEWEISKDGLMYTFYLKKGVKFHDGIELTADDVLFTYEQVIDPKNNSPFRSQYDLVEKFEIVNQYTFRINLKEPFPPLLYKLLLEIVPKHSLEGQNLHNTIFNYHPVGTGPFMFKSWDRVTYQIELESNPHYFEGRPYLDKTVVKVYSDNSQLLAAIMRQEVDLVHWITSDDYSVIEKDSAFKAYAVPFSMYYAMVYNVNDPIWQDRELRKAIAHGVNKREIIDALPRFDGEESTGPFHPDSIGYNHEVKPFKYDPIKAKMMLMHRGWKNINQDARDSENQARKKGSKELELRVLVDERSDVYKKMAAIIRQQLAEIGVEVTMVLYKDESEITQKYLREHRPQAWLRMFNGTDNLSEGYEVAINWYSLSSDVQNLWNYRNDEVDQLFESVRITTDKTERANIYKKIHEIIYHDQPACFLFFPAGYFAINAKFQNTNEYFSLHMPTYTIKDWYVEEK